MDNFIGLDVSKSTVSVFIPQGGIEIEIANTVKGFTQLFSKLKKLYKKEHDSLVFVYEPTGPFRILCQSGKITNTQGHRYEDRNRRRAICSRY
ncbi:hypothetical protein [Sulfurospirillum multivorans]|uniref:hypothetical protein n=1 Tax=Sulfurospirillum multivorans TaxID=66821 RepID=UPI00046D5955|nr:hypothetical protein [Sulfurospirillum multivorans]